MLRAQFPTSRTLSSTASAPTEGKGVNLLGFFRVVEHRHPELNLDEVLELVDPSLRDLVLRDKLLAGAWYPISWYCQLHAAIQEVTGLDPDLSWIIGRDSTAADFSTHGIYQFMARSLGPKTLLNIGHRIFNFYWRPGQMKIRDSKRQGYARARWLGCQGFDENVWFDVLGSVYAILETAGGQDIKIAILNASSDLSSLLVEAHWQRNS